MMDDKSIRRHRKSQSVYVWVCTLLREAEELCVLWSVPVSLPSLRCVCMREQAPLFLLWHAHCALQCTQVCCSPYTMCALHSSSFAPGGWAGRWAKQVVSGWHSAFILVPFPVMWACVCLRQASPQAHSEIDARHSHSIPSISSPQLPGLFLHLEGFFQLQFLLLWLAAWNSEAGQEKGQWQRSKHNSWSPLLLPTALLLGPSVFASESMKHPWELSLCHCHADFHDHPLPGEMLQLSAFQRPLATLVVPGSSNCPAPPLTMALSRKLLISVAK